MIISHPQGLLITEVDLVLTEVALTLRVLDLQPRGLHCQANRANDVLDHRRAKNGVVDVVGIGWLEIAVGLLTRRLVGLAIQHELQLGANLRGPSPLGQTRQLSPQDLAWRLGDGRTVVVFDIGEADDGAF